MQAFTLATALLACSNDTPQPALYAGSVYFCEDYFPLGPWFFANDAINDVQPGLSEKFADLFVLTAHLAIRVSQPSVQMVVLTCVLTCFQPICT